MAIFSHCVSVITTATAVANCWWLCKFSNLKTCELTDNSQLASKQLFESGRCASDRLDTNYMLVQMSILYPCYAVFFKLNWFNSLTYQSWHEIIHRLIQTVAFAEMNMLDLSCANYLYTYWWPNKHKSLIHQQKNRRKHFTILSTNQMRLVAI